MRQEIIETFKNCEECNIMIRKRRPKTGYITSSRIIEKVAIDLLDFKKYGFYVLISIDYFSRYVCAYVIPDKRSCNIIKV
ncbi:hypothetical protein COBT_001361 [Conglomerata obtusa]